MPDARSVRVLEISLHYVRIHVPLARLALPARITVSGYGRIKLGQMG
jgi:hypothetical protein